MRWRSKLSRRFAKIKSTQICADLLPSSLGNILVVVLLLLVFPANAQKLIRGMVVDSLSLNNLPGVTVKIKGSQRAAVTDENGIFLISVGSEDILSFSFLGYHVKEMPAQDDNDVMFVRMKEESVMLNEVTIQDYRYLDKKIDSRALQSIRALKAEKGLQPSTNGSGVGMAINFAYFTKAEKEKRKLMATLAEFERIKVYEAIIYEPNFMDEMMKKYSLDEDKYYELLAAFNQENSSLIRSGRELEIKYALHYYFSHPDSH